MRYFILFIILFIVASSLPWWCITFIMFLSGILCNSNQEAIVTGLILPTVIWMLMIGFRYITGGELIMYRVTNMFELSSIIWLILLSILIPAFTGFLSSLFGYQAKLLIFSKK